MVIPHLPFSPCSQGGEAGRESELFFASLFDCMWNVEWKWACLFLIFFFPCMGHDVLVKTHTRKKKKIKNRELQLCQTFHMQSDRLEVKWLSLPLLLMMAVPLKILFLLICFASKKMLFASRHVLNISLNLGFMVYINVKIIALGICVTFWRADKVL